MRRKPPTRSLPDPQELGDFPELAVLALLEVALQVTLHALVAANPELNADAEFLEEEGISPSTTLPFSLAISIHDLAKQIRLYRELIDQERAAKRAQPF